MSTTYLLLGSNIGDSHRYLGDAVKRIKKYIGKVTRQSKLYVTAAWGNKDQPDFLNQVIAVETRLTAAKTMHAILAIEKEMGRIRSVRNAPRVIDIDILFYNKDVIQEKNLSVPHPQIQYRRFVLVPLNELVPHFKHPVLLRSIHQLLLDCTDALNVKKY